MSDGQAESGSGRRLGKSEAAFRTISEVADDLEVPQHVLRFWEGRFPQVRPLKRGGGRRYYRPEDIALLRRIRDLLYGEGYTIKGVQKLLKEGAVGLSFGGDEDEEVESGSRTLLVEDEDNSFPGGEEDGSEGEKGQSATIGSVPSDLRGHLTDILVELETLRALLRRR